MSSTSYSLFDLHKFSIGEGCIILFRPLQIWFTVRTWELVDMMTFTEFPSLYTLFMPFVVQYSILIIR